MLCSYMLCVLYTLGKLGQLYEVFIVMTMKRQAKKKNVKQKPLCSNVTVTMVGNSVEMMLRGLPKETAEIVVHLCRL